MSVFDRFFLVLTLFLIGVAVILRPRLIQSGCDSPAHLLLSETLVHIDEPSGSAAFRTEIAQALEKKKLTEADLSRTLGPLCMHYRNERLNPQYPPLISAAMSIAPFSSRAQFFGLLCFILFLIAGYRVTGEWAHPVSLIAVLPLILPIFYPDLRSIEGYVPAFALVMLLVHESLRDDANAYLMGALGAALILCRYDGAFPLLALAVFLMLRRPYWSFILKGVTVFLACGVLPLCYFQMKSIGDAYRPLTPPYDLEWVKSFSEFTHAAMASLSVSQLDLAILFLCGAIWFRPERPVEARFKKAWLVSSAVGASIILTKQVQTAYYFWAWAAGMFALVLVQASRIEWNQNAGLRAFRALVAVGFVFSVVGVLGGFRYSVEQARLARDWKEAVENRFPREDRAIVEAGHWSGTLDAFRQSLGISRESLVIDGTHSSKETSEAFHQYAREQKISWYRFSVESNGANPRFEKVN